MQHRPIGGTTPSGAGDRAQARLAGALQLGDPAARREAYSRRAGCAGVVRMDALAASGSSRRVPHAERPADPCGAFGELAATRRRPAQACQAGNERAQIRKVPPPRAVYAARVNFNDPCGGICDEAAGGVALGRLADIDQMVRDEFPQRAAASACRCRAPIDHRRVDAHDFNGMRCAARSAQSLLPCRWGRSAPTPAPRRAASPISAPQEQMVELRKGEPARWTSVIALVRALRVFHLAQQGIHFGRSGADAHGLKSGRRACQKLVDGAIQVMHPGIKLRSRMTAPTVAAISAPARSAGTRRSAKRVARAHRAQIRRAPSSGDPRARRRARAT